MSDIKKGDVVARKSYGCDLMFKVVDIKIDQAGDKTAVLRGVDYRIEADAPGDDLKVVSDEDLERVNKHSDKWINKSINNIKVRRDKEFLRQTRGTIYRGIKMFEKQGRILHLDGANDFIDKCKEHYKTLGLDATVIEVSEKEQPQKVRVLLQEYNPDILVLTGHDGLIRGEKDYTKLKNYRNSIYFVNAVKEARKYEKSIDNLVIFAGACQSNYEAILDAGANFSSSPKRILIHMFDPVVVAEKIASTKIDRLLSIEEIVESTETGVDGIGGVQTRGRSRLGGPKMSYE